MPDTSALAYVLRVLSFGFFAAGALHLSLGLGADALLGVVLSEETLTDAGLDSQNRFYGTSFMLYGSVFWLAAGDLPRYETVLRYALWIFFCAGLARCISVWLYGWPPLLMGVLFALEVALPPPLLIWLARASVVRPVRSL